MDKKPVQKTTSVNPAENAGAAPEKLSYATSSFGLTVLHDVYTAAHNVLVTPKPTDEALAELRKAYDAVNVAIEEAKRLEHVFDRAQKQYSFNDGREINVVGDMTYSNEEDGFWVDAWVFVDAEKGEIEDYDPDEDEDDE